MVAVPILFEKLLGGVQRKIAAAPTTTKVLFSTMSGISTVLPFLRRPLFARVRKEMGLDKLRIAVSGGAALSERVANGLAALGIPIIQGYGLTETAPILTVNPLNRPKNASVGIALPDVEVEIEDPDSKGVGEVIARGPNVMMGYYNNKKATDEIIRDGWFHTGDIGYLDKDRYLHITGRIKSIIVTQTGKNIYPEELEDLLIKSQWIKEVLVIPRIEPKTKKEEVCALIYPDYELLEQYSIGKKITLTEEQVQEIFKDEVRKVNENLPIYKKITQFEIREEEFPKTTTLKIKRHMFIDRGIKV
jgi:long-chain acyl-CoA synthetase